MKTLILYATKSGSTGEAARRIAKRMDGAVVHDLKQGGVPSLEEYDCVVIGSALYVGAIRKEAKAYLAQNSEALRNKRLGLFLCGLEENQANVSIEKNFPPDLLKSAKVAQLLGGVFDPAKAGALDRFMVKVAAKQTEYKNSIDDGKIDEFVGALLA